MIILCEKEVDPSEEGALDSVLNADVERTALLKKY
jgi:hypothetical protein